MGKFGLVLKLTKGYQPSVVFGDKIKKVTQLTNLTQLTKLTQLTS